MKMRKGDLKDLILECTDQEFNENYLLQDDPWYFNRDDAPCDFSTFRQSISSVFKVTPANVFLVGSGYFGMSLSPDHPLTNYRLNNSKHGEKSDLDVVIISETDFENIWEDLLSAYYAGQHYIYNRYARTTFKKFVSFDKDIRKSNSGAIQSSTKFDRILRIYDDVNREASTTLRLTNEIKFRLYRNIQDMIEYHNWSLSELRKTMK